MRSDSLSFVWVMLPLQELFTSFVEMLDIFEMAHCESRLTDHVKVAKTVFWPISLQLFTLFKQDFNVRQ